MIRPYPSEEAQQKYLDETQGAPAEAIHLCSFMQAVIEAPPAIMIWAYALQINAAASTLVDFASQVPGYENRNDLVGVADMLRKAADRFDTVARKN